MVKKFCMLLAAMSADGAPLRAICSAAPMVDTASLPLTFSATMPEPSTGSTLAMSRSSTLPFLPADAMMPIAPCSFSGRMPSESLSTKLACEMSSISALYAVDTLPMVLMLRCATSGDAPAAIRKPMPLVSASVPWPVRSLVRMSVRPSARICASVMFAVVAIWRSWPLNSEASPVAPRRPCVIA
ncbi:hypothetical protein FQZ97_1049080 [compost metagenome]